MSKKSRRNKARKSRGVSRPVRNRLWAMSGNRCAYPTCRIELTKEGNEQDGPVTIGEIAHIYAHSPDGPRPHPDGLYENADGYDNLILLCSNHHRKVDGQPNTYSVAVLQQWKADHERWVAERLAVEEFNSAVLESIITWLTDHSIPASTDYTPPVFPAEKIKFNNLSAPVQNLITVGLSRVSEVEIYITDRSKLDSKFAERLLAPLLTQYNMLKADGYNSDYVFDDLRQFACGNSPDFSKQSAGLALIAYFFERCEIFER